MSPYSLSSSSIRWDLASICLVFLLMFGTPVAMIAQASGRGTIQGTVTDPTGAVIPGAQVSAVEVKTSVTRKQTTTGSGFYAIASIDPGIYTLTVTAPGSPTI